MKWHLTFITKESELFWELEVNNNTYLIREGESGTLGNVEIKTLESHEESLKIASELVLKKQSAGYLIKTISPFRHADLPLEVRSTLQSKVTVNTSRGKFIFSYADKIKLISVIVKEDSGITLQALRKQEIPRGLYFTTAYSLIESVPPAGIEGTLVWVPAIGKFASWNKGSFQLFIFNHATWKDIQPDLPRYIVAKKGEHSLCLTQSVIPLRECFDFIPTELPDLIGEILNTRDSESRQTKGESFLALYEKRLTIHPFSIYLESCFTGLGKIFYYLAQGYEAKGDYVKAVQYFQKAVSVAIQSPRLRTELLADLFVQLAYCYMQKGKFELALKNLDRYQLFDSSDKVACDKIRIKIERLQQLFSNENKTHEQEPKSHSLDDYNKAIAILKNKLKSSPDEAEHHYILACFYSITRKKAIAIKHLEQALICGFRDQLKISLDARFRNIRDTEEFQTLIERQFGDFN